MLRRLPRIVRLVVSLARLVPFWVRLVLCNLWDVPLMALIPGLNLQKIAVYPPGCEISTFFSVSWDELPISRVLSPYPSLWILYSTGCPCMWWQQLLFMELLSERKFSLRWRQWSWGPAIMLWSLEVLHISCGTLTGFLNLFALSFLNH